MQEFIAVENVKRFKAQLANCTDAHQRQTLERLLEEERLKLKAFQLEASSNHLAG